MLSMILGWLRRRLYSSEEDIFSRCLKYAYDKHKFTIDEMRRDLNLDDDEVEMLLRDHILQNYFPEVNNKDNRQSKSSAIRMLSLYGRGIYFAHMRTEE